MFRPASRLLSSSLRARTRINSSIVIVRWPLTGLTRRTMSSGSHSAGHGSSSSDMPWMIGSALVFGPLFLYLVSPSARGGSHGHSDADHTHKSHRDKQEENHVQHAESHQDAEPIADDEGTEVSVQEVKESMERAFEADSPKDAQERDEVVAVAEPTAAERLETSPAEPPTEAPPAVGAAESEQHLAPPAADDVTDEIPEGTTQSTDSTEPPAESKI